MAKVKIILWTHQQNQDGTYPIRIRLYKDKKTKYLATGYSIKKDHWNPATGKAKPSCPNYKRLNLLFAKIDSDTQGAAMEMETADKETTTYQIINRIRAGKHKSFFGFTDQYLERYNNDEQIITYRNYKSKFNIIREFVKNQDISFLDIDGKFLREFETHLRKRGNGVNTIHTNMKRIRMIFKAAIREGVIEVTKNPFLNYSLKQQKTHKEKLSLDELNRIRNLSLNPGTNMWMAKNMFLFSFNCMGMRFRDVCLLKWNQIIGDRVEYRMRKTKLHKSIALTTEAKSILALHAPDKKSDTDYVFPLMNRLTASSTRPVALLIASCTAIVNMHLIEIAKKAEIHKKVSTHVARHSWAQRAYDSKVDIRSIQKGLGHSDLSTTQIYLADLNDAALDKMNELVTTCVVEPYVHPLNNDTRFPYDKF